jgi:hypothetical protein
MFGVCWVDAGGSLESRIGRSLQQFATLQQRGANVMIEGWKRDEREIEID